MSYFPFIHMQVAWEDWSDAGLGAGWSSRLSPSPSLLATKLSPPHWLYSALLKPTDVGSAVPGAELAASPPQRDACFNIQLSHSEE